MGTHHAHLTMIDRQQIAALPAQSHSARSIGRQLKLHHSTVSRELARGRAQASALIYDPVAGQRVRAQRRSAAGLARRKLGSDSDSPRWRTVRGLLAANWSPQQLAGRLCRMADACPDSSAHRALCVSHETICCAIYAMPRGTLRTEIVSLLRKSHKSRMPRARGDERANALKDMTPIALRPPEVAARTVPGHWEGDLIKGAINRCAVGTLVERTSRYVMLVDLPGSDAQSVLEGFTRRQKSVPKSLRETLTYDQGREMALHKTLARNLKIDVFFCDAHSPWQRGTNENANGLIREYLPNGMDLSTVSRQQLTAIEHALNHRPRKILNFQTPHEVFSQRKLGDVRGVALQV